MFRMLLEVLLVGGIIAGFFIVNRTMAKESRENRAQLRKSSDDN